MTEAPTRRPRRGPDPEVPLRAPSGVAFLGPEGTFTAAATDLVAPGTPRRPLPSILDVVAEVRDGHAALGVVPIENSIEGAVDLTLDALVHGEPGAYIRGEVALPITMAVLAAPGARLDRVTEVRSHPVAIAQCRGWLAAHLPGAALVPVSSTAEAARQVVAEGLGVAALGNVGAGARFGLEVLAPDVADHGSSTTRFAVLGRTMAAATGADKTALVVFLGEDRPGLLLRVLEEFALRGVNLVRIESRPTKRALGDFCILLDAEGHPTEPRLAEALRGVHRHVAEVRLLGAWPAAGGVAKPPPATDSEAAYAEAGVWYDRLLQSIER